MRLARTQNSSASAHNAVHYPLWDEVKFIDLHTHWYTCRVKEAIRIRLHPNNISRNSGIEILEAWMTTIARHNNRTAERTTHRNSKDRNVPIINHSRWKPANHSKSSHRLMKTSSVQSKRQDSRPKWLHRKTNDNFLLLLPTYCISIEIPLPLPSSHSHRRRGQQRVKKINILI